MGKRNSNFKLVSVMITLFLLLTVMLILNELKPQIRYDSSGNPGSMYPMSAQRDAHLILYVNPENIQIGDIVAVKGENDFLHRVVDKVKRDGEYYFKTMGDNAFSNRILDYNNDLGGFEFHEDSIEGKVYYSFGPISNLLYAIREFSDKSLMNLVLVFLFIGLILRSITELLIPVEDIKKYVKLITELDTKTIAVILGILVIISSSPRIYAIANEGRGEDAILISNVCFKEIEVSGVQQYYGTVSINVSISTGLLNKLDYISIVMINSSGIKIGEMIIRYQQPVFGKFEVSQAVILDTTTTGDILEVMVKMHLYKYQLFNLGDKKFESAKVFAPLTINNAQNNRCPEI